MYLVSAADLLLFLDCDNTCKLHEAKVVEVIVDTKGVAVPGEVVPLIHVYAIAFVCDDLQKRM